MERFNNKMAKERLATLSLQISLTFMMLHTSLVFASTTAEDTFQKGIKSFKSGHYQSAEKFFLDAKKQGYVALQIDYNLGVATFKLKKYDAAILHFNKLISHPKFSAIAYYNIGLSLERQGKKEEARKYFKLASESKSNEKIQYLAQKKLNKKELSHNIDNKKNWDVYASVSYGYDDNIELIAKDTASSKEDSYIQSYLRARYKTAINVRTYISIFDISYDDFDAEDYQNIKLGVDYPFKFYDWKITPAFEYSESELGDKDYQNITDYKFKARKRFGKKSLTVSYRYSDIDEADNQYEYLKGKRQRIRINYQMPVNIGRLRLRYQFETNDREDTSLRSYSPERHSIEAKLSHELQDGWEVFSDVSYRNSDYPQKNNYAREDERYRFSIGSEYQFNNMWSVSAKYEYTDNHSNHRIDEYTRNVYQLSVNGKF
ncbi:MAG: tetratricopeptide repeat protein [Gammaproteobacteria bacterium]|nr:tetratricopeptide repeat protein [Gammaproteobacteria bacterium]